MKSFFRYEGRISSHELALAISLTCGVGPLCGFGRSIISGNGIKIYPNAEPGSTSGPANNIMDRILNRYIVKPHDIGESPNTNFAGVTRDGTIFLADDEYIDIPNISGIKGNLNEVLVFAIHTPITEPIDNPVSFVAYWNEASTDFYTLYKQSIDSYYPEPLDSRRVDVTSGNPNTKNMNYHSLINQIENSCSFYKANKQTAVLIGIYGTGTDAITKRKENFAIVPYEGQFPQPIDYNIAEKSNLFNSIITLENKIGGLDNYKSIKDYVNSKVDEVSKKLTETITLAILPVGSIILWEGSVIPKGWEEYSKASGRVVVGYQSGGITVNGSSRLTEIGGLYTPAGGNYDITIDENNLPRHRHAMGITKGSMENASGNDRSVVQPFIHKDTNLNGDVGNRGATIGVQSGAITSSYNLVDKSSTTESGNEKLVIEKLPPAVTLRYIIKRS